MLNMERRNLKICMHLSWMEWRSYNDGYWIYVLYVIHTCVCAQAHMHTQTHTHKSSSLHRLPLLLECMRYVTILLHYGSMQLLSDCVSENQPSLYFQISHFRGLQLSLGKTYMQLNYSVLEPITLHNCWNLYLCVTLLKIFMSH